MAFTETTPDLYEYGRPAGSNIRRPSPAGYLHIPIALSITMAALLLISKGWISMKKAVQRGANTIEVSAPGPVIQLSHFDTPSDMASPIAPLFAEEVLQWSDDILRWADIYDLDPNLIATVMQIESCGHPEAVSRAGAEGLFQVMPYHFAEGENSFDPDTNAHRGMEYLRRSLDLAGCDTSLALAGYNGGHGVISMHRSEWAAETLRYVYWGTGIYNDARKNKSGSDRLEEWLQSGGASLCASSNSFALSADN